MKQTRNNNSNISIINFVMILGVFVFLTMGCNQINDAVNSNKATNTNTATNSNSTANSNASTNANANSNVTANNNANANTSASPTNSSTNNNTQASNTAANIATVTKEGVPLTQEAKVFVNNLIGEWNDGKETLIFTEDKLENRTTKKILTYRIIDEKSVEFTDNQGNSNKATMTFEDNGNTLVWFNHVAKITFRFNRVNPK